MAKRVQKNTSIPQINTGPNDFLKKYNEKKMLTSGFSNGSAAKIPGYTKSNIGNSQIF